MPRFKYRALTVQGEIVHGVLEASELDLVGQRVRSLGLTPIDGETTEASKRVADARRRPRPEDVTIFSRDLALLLCTGVRINDALDLLASDHELGRMRAIAAELHNALLSGHSFGEALGAHPEVFSPLYVALARVGEQTAMLHSILEAIAAERLRAEALRRRILDSLRYPAFLLASASGVLVFFLTFVLPQFAAVFSDFQAKPDPVLATFLALSASLRGNPLIYSGIVAAATSCLALMLRSASARARLYEAASRLPFVCSAFEYHRVILFCRNLALLLAGGVTLSDALRILVDVMSATGAGQRWHEVVDSVRRGGKLSDGLAAESLLPAMAIRTLRIGENSNQLPTLSARVADYYEVRLNRSIDRIVGIVGPLAIIVISAIVGGLIVSVMTALLSVNQMVDS